jgi:hypothetical protein
VKQAVAALVKDKSRILRYRTFRKTVPARLTVRADLPASWRPAIKPSTG